MSSFKRGKAPIQRKPLGDLKRLIHLPEGRIEYNAQGQRPRTSVSNDAQVVNPDVSGLKACITQSSPTDIVEHVIVAYLFMAQVSEIVK